MSYIKWQRSSARIVLKAVAIWDLKLRISTEFYRSRSDKLLSLYQTKRRRNHADIFAENVFRKHV